MYLKYKLIIADYHIGNQDSIKITAINFIIIVKEDSNVFLVESDSNTELTTIVILLNH
jgi:hypothetical protein